MLVVVRLETVEFAEDRYLRYVAKCGGVSLADIDLNGGLAGVLDKLPQIGFVR